MALYDANASLFGELWYTKLRCKMPRETESSHWPNKTSEDSKEQFDNAISTSIILDSQYKIIVWGTESSRMFGYKEKDVVQKNLFELLIPDYSIDRLNSLIKNSLQNPVKVEVGIRWKKKKTILISMSSATIADQSIFICTVHDLTKSMVTEHFFHKSKERFELVMSATRDGVFDWDRVTNGVFYSLGWKKMLGYSDAEVQNTLSEWERLTDPDDKENIFAVIEQAISKNEPRFEVEFRMKHKSGDFINILGRAFLIYDEKGTCIRIVGTHVDTTERKNREAVNESRLHLLNFANEHSLDELIEEALNKVERLTGSHIGFYHFVEPDQKSIRLQNWSKQTKESFCKAEGIGVHYSIDQAGVWVDCLKEGQAVVHNDYAALENKKGLPDGHADVIRELVVPIYRGGLITSIMGVGNKSIYYDSSDVEVVTAFAEMIWDIVDRKISENRLQESESKLRKLFELSMDAIFIVDMETGRYLEANSAAEKMTGRSIQEILSKTTDDLTPKGAQWRLNELHTTQKNTIDFGEVEYLQPDGSIKYAELSIIPLTDRLAYGLAHDITERKENETILIESEERLKSLHEASFGGIAIHDKGFILDCNNGLAEMTGYTMEELLGMNGLGLIADHTRDFVLKQILSGTEEAYETIGLKKDGTEYPVRLEARMIPYKGKMVRSVEFRDISDFRRIEESLRENEKLLRKIADNIPNSYLSIIENDFTIGFTAGLEFYKRKLDPLQFMGKPLSFIFNNDVLPVITKHYEQTFKGEECSFEIMIDDEHQHYRTVPLYSDDGAIDRILVVVENITHRKYTEERMQRLDKLESIGLLAGGIAHDFNNLLTGVYGNISLAKAKLPETDPAFQLLESAQKSMDRATSLTTQLLTFSKGGEPIKDVVNIEMLIQNVVNFDLSGSNVKPVIHQPDHVWPIYADEGQVQQVLSNLIINADQAMEKGGHLYIAIENLTLDKTSSLNIEAGKYIKIEFRDEGPGISEDNLSKIFDPYYTTKMTGNGLGLSTAYSIVNKHGGMLEVTSTLRKGTTFTLYLPAVEGSYLSMDADGVDTEKQLKSARVLIMDDENTILSVLKMMLEDLNCRVSTAINGEEVIALYKEGMDEAAPYDVVILDLTIPAGMGGEEAVSEILKLDPFAKCIVSSGYSTGNIVSNYSEFGFVARMSKPYSFEELQTVMQSVLGIE